MDSLIPVLILDDIVCISFRENTFGKGMNPFLLAQSAGAAEYINYISAEV